ncbi:unnamed protein product, partial [Polarella glacialis]
MSFQWQFQDDGDAWVSFATVDSDMLEEAFSAGRKVLRTIDLSFNKGHKTLYHFDFKAMTQLNTESKNKRTLRREKMKKTPAAAASKASGGPPPKKAKLSDTAPSSSPPAGSASADASILTQVAKGGAVVDKDFPNSQ